MAEKGGYKHFMLKEIHEQPRAVRDTLAGRFQEEAGDVHLEDLKYDDATLQTITRMVIVACGTSWHAALTGKFLIEEHCRIPVEVDIASEFRYRKPVIDNRTLVMVISQSGETADTLAALREARQLGALNLAICNVLDSSIAREAAGVLYTHAGPEIGVASTKAFVTQLAALHLFTIRLGRAIGKLDVAQGRSMSAGLKKLPELLEQCLGINNETEKVAKQYMHARDFLYLGRGKNYPIALEGALKLKEISYIHAEGYPAGEMKHGPISLIDEEFPTVAIVTQDATFDKMLSNIQEIKARNGRVLAIAGENSGRIADVCDDVIRVPETLPILQPVLNIVPLQLFAYFIARAKGCDIDKPRNLAKAVTVE
jgi:glucosamine--fructose-6-phosphate aminotransferase (isomerizing)